MSCYYNSQAVKKSCKKLKEIERLKQKPVLNEEEKEKVSKELFYKDIVRRNKVPCFDDFPDEIVNTIVTFLPPHTRIAIFKRKYNKKCIKELLEKMPCTLPALILLWPCAAISREIATKVFPRNSDLHALLSGTLQNVKVFRDDFEQEKQYLYYYRAEFEKLIVAVLQHYTRVYQEPSLFTKYDNKRVRFLWAREEKRRKERVEFLVLKLYMHLKVILQLK